MAAPPNALAPAPATPLRNPCRRDRVGISCLVLLTYQYPAALERQLGLDFLGQPLVGAIDGLDEVTAVPQAHGEVLLAGLAKDHIVEAPPAHQQALLCLKSLHDALQRAVHGDVSRRLL